MNWMRFKACLLSIESLRLSVDISRIPFPDDYFDKMAGPMRKAFAAMTALEQGAIANPDENRMVGHYWLRDAQLAPDPEIAAEIEHTLQRIAEFAQQIHAGSLQGQHGQFTELLVIGIGGSALGPQLVSQALADSANPKLRAHFFDNTDPDGFDTTLKRLSGKLGTTLVLVISKSGGTPETRNGMVEAEHAYRLAGLDFSQHAVAVTGRDSKLDRVAVAAGWLARFPMWDWVGGRTSELGPVGLLPAALEGIDIDALLAGARTMDTITRQPEINRNPAALLALMWYFATDGVGRKDMVILPYKDRLMLLSKYLQQLVMESLGKEFDTEGNRVQQGLTVYGNKGSTDQHAYIQQLREGVPNFFATFIEVLKDRDNPSVEVEPGFTAGDYLQGLLLGTRDALSENQRASITITIEAVDPQSVGALIALYERAVGFYASLVGINAYHQPGVEAGKQAAATTLQLKQQIVQHLQAQPEVALTADAIAEALHQQPRTELIFKLLEHLAANPDKNVKKLTRHPIFESGYFYCHPTN